MDWFGVSIAFAPPVTVKPVPVTATEEIETFVFPVFVKETSCEAVFPTAKVPNSKLVALAESLVFVVTPFPDRAIDSGDPPALLEIAMLPA